MPFQRTCIRCGKQFFAKDSRPFKHCSIACRRTGKALHPAEYSVWRGMRNRCENPKEPSYKRYGGRGIAVCERWLKFENFFADMGAHPSSAHSIGRKDNNGPYSPDNCEWVTQVEQCNNTSRNVLLTFNGRTQSISQWSRELKLGQGALISRLRRGWSVEAALTFPYRLGRSPKHKSNRLPNRIPWPKTPK